MPRLVLSIEPVVSTRQIKWSLITKPIESRLREIVLESIVMPHMDDIAFLNTKPYAHRGGIFADCARKAAELDDGTGPGVNTGHTDEGNPDDEEDNEAGNIAPGVPNLKLGDDRSESPAVESVSTASNMRQRLPESRKVSDSGASIKSSQSVPLLDETRKDKDNHARKKSWFSSSLTTSTPSPPAAKANRLQTTESDTALPLDSNNSKVESSPSSTVPARHLISRKSAPATPESIPEGTDGAAERLRGILESGKKSRSNSGPSADEISKSVSALDLEVSASSTEHAKLGPSLIVSPEHPTTSVSKVPSNISSDGNETSQAPLTTSLDTHNTASTTGSSVLPPLFRDRSDTSVSSIATNSSGSSASAFRISSGLSPTASPISTSSSGLPASGSSTTLLTNWRAKAADKQALQASVDRGVLQAKDTMSKWSNKWQAYRKQQSNERQDISEDASGAAADPTLDVFGSSAQSASSSETLTPEKKQLEATPAVVMSKSPSQSSAGSISSHRSRPDENYEGRSRANSVISTSPRILKPHAPTTTTSLTTGESVSMMPPSASTSPNLSSRSPGNFKRVPPPSTVPVHPAFSNNTQARRTAAQSKQPGMSDKTGYQAATMMAIPGIDKSKVFSASSEDFKKNVGDKSANIPTLPARPGDVSTSPAASETLSSADASLLSHSLPEGTALSQPIPPPLDLLPNVLTTSEPAKPLNPPLPPRNKDAIDSPITEATIPSVSVLPATPSEIAQ